MTELTKAIQGYLQAVDHERERRRGDLRLSECVVEIKRFQHARFSETYSDLIESPQTAKAVRFFLEELYGPIDFSGRDAEFSRVAPQIARLFPGEIGHIVLSLVHLHALSERLDSEMGAALTTVSLSKEEYRRVWLFIGQPGARNEQITLVRRVGLALAEQVRKPLLRTALRLMRHPAHAAGLGRLQSILELGLDAFRDLPCPEEFVLDITQRESRFIENLFGGTATRDP